MRWVTCHLSYKSLQTTKSLIRLPVTQTLVVTGHSCFQTPRALGRNPFRRKKTMEVWWLPSQLCVPLWWSAADTRGWGAMTIDDVQMTQLGHDDLMSQVCGFWRQHMGHPGRVSGRLGQNRSEVRCIHGDIDEYWRMLTNRLGDVKRKTEKDSL